MNKENRENNFLFKNSFYLNLHSIQKFSPKKQSYELHQGDIVKLGRIKFKIKDLCIEGKMHYHQKLQYRKIPAETPNEDNNNKFNLNSNYCYSIKKVCRICYCDDKEGNSTLINPCKCSGGVKYIHYSCLQHWIKTKSHFRIISSNDKCIIYSYVKMKCEICKEAFPDIIKENNEIYDVYNLVENQFASYITLESIPTSKDESVSRLIISFDKKHNLIIGRSHEVDIRINDITVSRFHAELILIKKTKKIYFQDLKSKFGSFVYLQNPYFLISDKFPLVLQSDKSVLTFIIAKKCFDLYKCLTNFFNCKNTHDGNLLYDMYGKKNASLISIEKVFSVKDNNRNIIDDCCNQTLSSINNKNGYKKPDEISISVYNSTRLNLNSRTNLIDLKEKEDNKSQKLPFIKIFKKKKNILPFNGELISENNVNNKSCIDLKRSDPLEKSLPESQGMIKLTEESSREVLIRQKLTIDNFKTKKGRKYQNTLSIQKTTNTDSNQIGIPIITRK